MLGIWMHFGKGSEEKLGVPELRRTELGTHTHDSDLRQIRLGLCRCIDVVEVRLGVPVR